MYVVMKYLTHTGSQRLKKQTKTKTYTTPQIPSSFFAVSATAVSTNNTLSQSQG